MGGNRVFCTLTSHQFLIRGFAVQTEGEGDEAEQEAGLIDWDDVYCETEALSDDENVASLPGSNVADGGAVTVDEDEGAVAQREADETDADALLRSVTAADTGPEEPEQAAAAAAAAAAARPAKKRTASAEGSDERSFIPFETFAGAKKGFVFKSGKDGVGYYKDKPPQPKKKKFKKTKGTSRGEKKRQKRELKKQLKQERGMLKSQRRR